MHLITIVLIYPMAIQQHLLSTSTITMLHISFTALITVTSFMPNYLSKPIIFIRPMIMVLLAI